jgi:hypothetical protein
MALVDQHLGRAPEWPSRLVQYRFTSEWQADWKAELGHWLHTAERLGFLDVLVKRVLGRARRRSRSQAIDPNDQRHLDLLSEVAAATTVHYLTGTGWAFRRWEPVVEGDGDVDIELIGPSGAIVNVQVKAPDQPGRRSMGHVVDGEYDDRINTALRKAQLQLSPFREAANVIVMCARRDAPLSQNAENVVRFLYGRTTVSDHAVTLYPQRRGWFFTCWWQHVGGVLLLDYVRGIDTFLYACTVLVNPWATVPVSASWFPFARACVLDEDVFRWVNGEPGRHGATTLPDETFFVR